MALVEPKINARPRGKILLQYSCTFKIVNLTDSQDFSQISPDTIWLNKELVLLV